MGSYLQHYIGGQWVDSEGGTRRDVINPATEEVVSTVTLGTAADVDKAVKAARQAFDGFSQSSKADRVALLERVVEEYKKRIPDIAKAISEEMGAPMTVALTAQSGSGLGHLMSTIEALKGFDFEECTGKNQVVYEAIGVVALITPWNWPMNQIVAKVAPAIAAGNAVILKPSEQTPGSAAIFAEVMDAAGVPAGVFNLVQGDGPGVGTALAQHPDIDMISFTGSTRAGILVAKNARRHGEARPPGAWRQIAEHHPARHAARPRSARRRRRRAANSGQSCIAPTRLLVHSSQYEEAIEKLTADLRRQGGRRSRQGRRPYRPGRQQGAI